MASNLSILMLSRALQISGKAPIILCLDLVLHAVDNLES